MVSFMFNLRTCSGCKALGCSDWILDSSTILSIFSCKCACFAIDPGSVCHSQGFDGEGSMLSQHLNANEICYKIFDRTGTFED